MTAGDEITLGIVGVWAALGQVCWVRHEHLLSLYGSSVELASDGQQTAGLVSIDPMTPV